MTMKKFYNYIGLYTKSLKFVWKTSQFMMLWMIMIVPIQAILPSISIYITNIVLNKISFMNSLNITLVVISWGVVFFLNNLMSPLLVMIQGKLTDLLTYKLNTDLMQKSENLQSISFFEDSEFYNDIQLLSSEASWRPVNLLVFGSSLISNAIMFGSMLLIVSSISILMSVILFFILIPQGIVTYRIQQQAFETLVSNTEESRKLDYYSQVLLSNNHIKDIRLYNLYSFFIKKYTDTFSLITGKLQVDRRKKFINSTLFLTINSIVILAMFGHVIIQIKQGRLDFDSPRTLIRIEESQLVTEFIDLKLPRIKFKFGEKWLLTGRNKSGKSILLNSLVKKEIEGYYSQDLKIGYFSQKLELLDKEKSLFDNIYSRSVQNKQLIINFLAMLDLKKDKIFIPCNKLSGGEQVKGQLAMVLLSDSNFLILDEPTNFLDINSFIAFENFLKNFSGTVLLVCHDIYIQKKINFKKLTIKNNQVF